MAGSYEDRKEGIKLIFEILKHLTTLNTAAALVVLAIGREVEVALGALVVALMLFGSSVVVCLFGMVSVSGLLSEGEAGADEYDWGYPLRLCAVASGLFIGGFILFALYAAVL